MGAESFSGGTITTSIVEVVSPSREQLGQWNKWLIVSRSTSVDRVHRMSTWQAGQTGGSSSLNARLILSTMLGPAAFFSALHIARSGLLRRYKCGHQRGNPGFSPAGAGWFCLKLPTTDEQASS